MAHKKATILGRMAAEKKSRQIKNLPKNSPRVKSAQRRARGGKDPSAIDIAGDRAKRRGQERSVRKPR